MKNTLIDGKKMAQKCLEKIKKNIAIYLSAGLRAPKLGTILIGNNKISQIYIERKEKEARNAGINTEHFQLNDDCCQEELLNLILELNSNKDIDGILIQQPLPNYINLKKIFLSLSPKKDVEGMHPENYGKLLYDSPYFIPCTPKSCLRLIDETNVKLRGSRVVIVGDSVIAGRPLAFLLMNKDATVTVCNEYTKNLAKITSQAEILLSATGIAHLIGEEHVNTNAIVIDIGISKLNCGTIVGDVNTNAVKHKVKAITPVPGGVGPMTIAMLLENILIAYKRNIDKLKISRR